MLTLCKILGPVPLSVVEAAHKRSGLSVQCQVAKLELMTLAPLPALAPSPPLLSLIGQASASLQAMTSLRASVFSRAV